jgi:CHAT domain-containing protein/Tfp pilus assembly protein PilF
MSAISSGGNAIWQSPIASDRHPLPHEECIAMARGRFIRWGVAIQSFAVICIALLFTVVAESGLAVDSSASAISSLSLSEVRSLESLHALQQAQANAASVQQKNWEALAAETLQLYRAAKYAEAETLARRTLDFAEKEFGTDDPLVAVSMNNLASILEAQGKLSGAEPLFRRALEMREKHLGSDHPSVAGSLNSLAVLHRKQGRLDKAEPLLRRALFIQEKHFGPEHPSVATFANNLASVLSDLGRLEEAEALQRLALQIREKNAGSDDESLAVALNNLAGVLTSQGKFALAEPLYRRAIAIQEKTLGPEHPELAGTLSDFAVLLDEQGKPAAAEPLYLRSLAIRRKAFGPDHADVALVLNNLCSLYRTLGRYAEAGENCQLALDTWSRALGPDHPSVADALNNLALLQADQGYYSKVEPNYRRALALREKAFGADHPLVANSLNNLALFYQEQGKYTEAEPLLRRALEIREKAFGPAHPSVATSLNNLAVLCDQQGQVGEAEAHFRRALSITEKAKGPEHADVATSLSNLALLIMRSGNTAEAEAFLLRALSIREKRQGPEHPDVAGVLNNLAGCYRSQRRFAEAEALYQRSLRICETSLGPEHSNTGTALLNLAGFYFSQGDLEKAEPLFSRSLRNLARRFQEHFTYMSEKERLSFLETVSNTFPFYFNFCISSSKKSPALAGDFYNAVLWQKGLVVSSVAELRARMMAAGDTESLRLLGDLSATKSRIARLQAEALASRERSRLEMDNLVREANDIEQQLVRRSASLSSERELARVTWRDIARELKSGEAAVEVVRFRVHDGQRWTQQYEYFALIITADTADAPHLVLLGDAKELEGTPLRSYREMISAEGSFPAAKSVKQSNATSVRMSPASLLDAFWNPIVQYLAGIRRIYISLDGVLNQISIGILPASNTLTLADEYDLRILTSTRDVLRKRAASKLHSAALFGNPAFDWQEPEHLTKAELIAKPSGARKAQPWNSENRTRAQLGEELSPLPGTQAEVHTLRRLLRASGWQVQTFVGAQAQEGRLKNVRSPRLLHIATHGFFLPDRKQHPSPLESAAQSILHDPMMRSGLYFAGANRILLGGEPASDSDDGILTAYEASGIDLHGTQLVVLSACETGLGHSVSGEGVFGLRRALQVAGAQSILMSLWAVPDRETQELMSLFYSKLLTGKEEHIALREAQRVMRARVRMRYGKDLPFYWGAFVLVGN